MNFTHDLVEDLLPLNDEHRKKWLDLNGYLLGSNVDESDKIRELFSIILNNWEIYKVYQISTYFIDICRQAVYHLYSEEKLDWRIKDNELKLFVYRSRFRLIDLIDHIEKIMSTCLSNLRDVFKSLSIEYELCKLSLKDYFEELYLTSDTSIDNVRDLKIKNVIE